MRKKDLRKVLFVEKIKKEFDLSLENTISFIQNS